MTIIITGKLLLQCLDNGTSDDVTGIWLTKTFLQQFPKVFWEMTKDSIWLAASIHKLHHNKQNWQLSQQSPPFS